MSTPAPTLVVLAAGMGSRYGGLKQIDPVGPHGEVVLDYSVFDALRAGFGRVVFLIRRELEASFREQMLPRYAGRAEVAFAYQELDMLPAGFAVPPGRTKPWGTAHAVWCCAGAVSTPFAVINADDFYGAESYRLLHGFLSAPAAGPAPDYAMVGFRLGRTLSDHGSVARAVCTVDEAGRLVQAEELTAIEKTPEGARHAEPDGTIRRLTGRELVSMNMWGFRPDVFEKFGGEFDAFLREHGTEPKSEFYIPNAVSRLIDRGAVRCRVLPTESDWFGVTYREDKPGVEASLRRLITEGCYPERLWG
jgi:hypothetical protein